MSKVILVVSDGLRDDTAATQMGYLEHLVEVHAASRYTVLAQLPTMSRPLYETLHTGLPSSAHGITHNRTVRRSNQPNVFELAAGQGLTTAASAYYWFSELYNRAPYDPVMDREVDDEALAIQHGRFYLSNSTPDGEVFAAAAMLLGRHRPDYLLVHPAGMDYLGETYGASSAEYRRNAVVQDQILAEMIPGALRLGYTALVTADHGVGDDGLHGGTLPEVRQVPLYVIGPAGRGQGNTRRTVSQLQIAPTLCRLLAIPAPPTMAQPAVE